MRSTTESLVDSKWVSNPPTYHGQRIKVTTYFDDGTFGVLETLYDGESRPDMRITNLSFENRMTRDERKAIRRAALTNEDVQDFMGLAAKATHIDLSLQQTIDSVNALEQMGLLGEGRAAEILYSPINDDEQYRGDL